MRRAPWCRLPLRLYFCQKLLFCLCTRYQSVCIYPYIPLSLISPHSFTIFTRLFSPLCYLHNFLSLSFTLPLSFISSCLLPLYIASLFLPPPSRPLSHLSSSLLSLSFISPSPTSLSLLHLSLSFIPPSSLSLPRPHLPLLHLSFVCSFLLLHSFFASLIWILPLYLSCIVFCSNPFQVGASWV